MMSGFNLSILAGFQTLVINYIPLFLNSLYFTPEMDKLPLTDEGFHPHELKTFNIGVAGNAKKYSWLWGKGSNSIV